MFVGNAKPVQHLVEHYALRMRRLIFMMEFMVIVMAMVLVIVDDDGCLALFAQPGLWRSMLCCPWPRCVTMMITMRRKRSRGVVMVIVIMMMIIMKTYQVPYSQGQMHTLVLRLLKKRPEAISYCNCNWRRYVFRRLELLLPKKNAVEY